MRVAVVGPGALGTLFAVRLALSGTRTLLLDYRRERAKTLTKQGLRLIDIAGEHVLRVPVTADPCDLAAIDAVIILVKSYHTEDLAATLAEYLPPRVPVLTLQNGLGNIETLQLHLGADRVFGGTTGQGGLLDAPGVVRDTGSGPTVVGSVDGRPDPRLDDIAQVLLLAGFAVSITGNLQSSLWQKLILNAAINPVGALTRLRNGELAEHEPSLKLMTALARETVAVARKHRVSLEEHDWRARLQTACQVTAQNRNSMLQDVAQQRRTEIDAINGAVVRVAEQYKMPAPINRTLWYLIGTLEQSYRGS